MRPTSYDPISNYGGGVARGSNNTGPLLQRQVLSASGQRLLRPAIADFTLAQHNHQNAEGGGLLTLDAFDPNAFRRHFGALYYSTGGNAGGQVIGAAEVQQAFDVADPDSYGLEVTTGAGAMLRTLRAGVYNIAVQEYISDVSTTTFIVWIDISVDDGANYTRFRYPDSSMVALTQGVSFSQTHWLPAFSRVRVVIYNGGGNTRVAAGINNADYCRSAGPKLTMVEVGRDIT